MIPLALQLNNFMSYRTPTSIDFSGIRTACLSGDNGAGKSALLEAMTWAVWGKSRAASDRDVITVGESQMEVTFDFRLNEREYRVFRRRTAGTRASSTVEFYVRDIGAEDWTTISADSVRETDRKIVATLKMDYETFVNSAFLMQGQADTFTQKRPAERKKVLGDILNLGDYDILSQMARDEERTLRARSGHLTSLIARLDEQLDKRPEVEAALETLSQGLIAAGSKVDALESETRTVQEALNAMAGLIRTRDASTARLERHEKRLAEVGKLIASERSTIDHVRKTIDSGPEIERQYAELLKWREVSESCASILRERQPVEAALRETESQIERARGDMQRQVDRHLNAEKQAQAALEGLARREAELKTLQEGVARSSGVVQQLERVRDEQRKSEAEKATLEAECKALKDAMNEIKQNMDLLATGDAECPICRRPMRDGEHEHVKALWTAEGTQLGDQFRNHRERIKQLEERLPEFQSEVRKLEKARTNLSENEAVIRRIEIEIAERPKLETEARQAATEADRLTTMLVNSAFAPELSRKAQEYAAQLEKLTYNTEQAMEADQKLQQLRGVEKQHAELQTARVRFAALQESHAERVKTADEMTDEISALKQEIEDIQRQLEDEPTLQARLAEKTDTLERARVERDEIQGRFGATQNQLEHLDRLAGERKRHQAELGTMAIDADAYKELGVAFGRNGIQAMIVETILPELEDEANRLLSRMTTSHLRVSFRSTRQAVSNENIIETLDIIIRDESGERPYALYSGGEAFRVDFAIRVALSKLLVRRAGTTIDMLIIDEGFGTQDARGRDGLVEALQSVESDFATILVITHIDEVRDLFPTRIEVTKTDSGSQVAVV